MKYLIVALLLVGCTKDELAYRVESKHIVVEGKSKTDAATAKAASAVNQLVIDSVDK
jgi:uncharacterized protein YcfL